MQQWYKLGLRSARQLRLVATLQNGQCFGWAPESAVSTAPDGPSSTEVVFRGVIGRNLFSLKETQTDVLFSCTEPIANLASEAQVRAVLHDFFQLDTDQEALVERWTREDPEIDVTEALQNNRKRIRAIVGGLEGLRCIRQDPVECLFSFITSSNNNISRIQGIMHRIRVKYGDPLDPPYHYSFPTVERLAQCTEQEFRDLGLGYRAKYFTATSKLLLELGGRDWLLKLRAQDRAHVQEQLMQFKGVGRKVADCVALFSLDQTACVPVDTHVWQIAVRDFSIGNDLQEAKSITPQIYASIGQRFHAFFGDHCGWAHQILFAAELPLFADRIPAEILADLAAFKVQYKAEKKARSPAKKRKSPTKKPTQKMSVTKKKL
jgi:N-glycosylase/DNA lyase